MTSNIVNYSEDLRKAVNERLEKYEIDRPYQMWIHVRSIISLRMKNDTGNGLVKGNRPISQEQYLLGLKYLDEILPKI